MIIIFDLDDTLYPEITYVKSGLKAVSYWGQEKYGWPHRQSYQIMYRLLQKQGRGRIFDTWFAEMGLSASCSLVKKAVACYRNHKPDITLPQDSIHCLRRFAHHSTYIVTDGHKGVQDKKLIALEVRSYVQHAYITHRYGLNHAKPSLHCFDLIKRREKAEWQDMMYIGDNPLKDFVNLNKVGAKTVRIKQGMFKDMIGKQGYDAQITISHLNQLNIN